MRRDSGTVDFVGGLCLLFWVGAMIYKWFVEPLILALQTDNFKLFALMVAIDCAVVVFAFKSYYKRKYEEALRQEKINHRIAIDKELMGLPQRLDEIMTDLIRAKKKLFDGYSKMEFESPTTSRPHSYGVSIEEKILAMEWDIAELFRAVEAVDNYTRRNERVYNLKYLKNIDKIDEVAKVIVEYAFPERGELLLDGFTRIAAERIDEMNFDEREDIRKLYEYIANRLELVENFLKSRQQGGGVPREMEDLRNKIIADSVLHRLDFDDIYPQAAQMVSQIEVLYLEYMAKQLDWGRDVQRAKKVENLRTIKADTQALIKKYATYEILFEYLIDTFPVLYDYVCPLIRTSVSNSEVQEVTEYIENIGEWLPERFKQ